MDLMSEILIQISKNPNRYNSKRLPKILKKPFGLPRKVHREAWEKFKQEQEEAQEKAMVAMAGSAKSVQEIVQMDGKPFKFVLSASEKWL